MNEITGETIRRYLLGDLAEAERAALEDRFLGDALVFEQIEDAENDLVDDYVAERLSAETRAKFEKYYLALPESAAKVAAARALRTVRPKQTAEAPAAAGFWRSIQNFFASFRLVPALAAAAVLLFVLGGLWLAFRPQQNNQIAQLPPTPQAPREITQSSPTPAPDTNFNSLPNANSSPLTSPTPAPTAAPKEPPRVAEPKTPPPIVTLALITGLVRGSGEQNKLILPKNAAQVRLLFDLPAKNYRDLEARIETVSGARVWNGKIRSTGRRAALNLPTGIFQNEDYLLITSGINESGERKDFAEFYFNSERK